MSQKTYIVSFYFHDRNSIVDFLNKQHPDEREQLYWKPLLLTHERIHDRSAMEPSFLATKTDEYNRNREKITLQVLQI